MPRIEGLKPAAVTKVAMLGGGVMGSGIVHLLLIGGFQAVLWDIHAAALDKGLASLRGTFDYHLKNKKMSAAELEGMLKDRLVCTSALEDLKDADLVSVGAEGWEDDEQTLLSMRGNVQGVILKELPSPESLSRARLDVFSTPGEYAAVNEIQFFSILNEPPASLPGQESHYIVDPGSKMSVSARLRSCAPVSPERSPGS